MKHYNGMPLPVGVSLTHDKGYPVVFGYVGGHGRVRMRAKRFNPNVVGSVEEAIEQARRWREDALLAHAEAMAALPPRKRNGKARHVTERVGKELRYSVSA